MFYCMFYFTCDRFFNQLVRSLVHSFVNMVSVLLSVVQYLSRHFLSFVSGTLDIKLFTGVASNYKAR